MWVTMVPLGIEVRTPAARFSKQPDDDMSIQALAWVFDQDIRPSSVKFVLLALADTAGNGSDPSIAKLCIEDVCKKTSQERTEVTKAVQKLERLGMLEAINRTENIFRIVCLPVGGGPKRHYVYKLVSGNGEFYIGVRSCHLAPEGDEYFGSGRWPQSFKRGQLKKEILTEFTTREEAEAEEIRTIRSEIDNPLLKNVMRNSKRFPVYKDPTACKSPSSSDEASPSDDEVFTAVDLSILDAKKSTANEFIASWCAAFKEHFGEPYDTTVADAGQARRAKIRGTVDDMIAVARHCWNNGKDLYHWKRSLTIRGFLTNYTEIKITMEQGHEHEKVNGHTRSLWPSELKTVIEAKQDELKKLCELGRDISRNDKFVWESEEKKLEADKLKLEIEDCRRQIARCA